MGYEYAKEKPWVCSEDGQKQFLAIRDKVKSLIKIAGVVRMDCAIAGQLGSSWQMLACVDRLVELGELREISPEGVAGQHRIFVSRDWE